MTINEIKKEAVAFKPKNLDDLSEKLLELKVRGIAFLGCVAFVQENQKISLEEARCLTLKLDIWMDEERNRINSFLNLMHSEFDEDE